VPLPVDDERPLPIIPAAVRTSATVGEITDALRAVFGTHVERVVL
jgi:methylmalonyl-CoA mutase N-terminal domain/subunit